MLPGVIGKVLVNPKEVLMQLIEINVIGSTIDQNSYIPSRRHEEKLQKGNKDDRGLFKNEARCQY